MAFILQNKRLLLQALIIVFASYNAFTEETKPNSNNKGSPLERLPKSSECGNSKPKTPAVCKPVLNDKGSNDKVTQSSTTTTRQCLPFVPLCPCANKIDRGPTCAADIQLGFVVPISSTQPMVDVHLSNFVKNVVSRFHLSPKRTQVSVVTYGTTPKMSFSFDRFSCKREVLHELNSLAHLCPHGRPRIGKALSYLDHRMFKKSSRKSKVVVLLTDSSSCDDVRRPAKHLRSNNIRILTVGIGRYINGKQMDEIATRPLHENIFSSDLNYLHLITEKVVKNICLGAGGFLEQPTHRPCLCKRPT